MLLLVRRDPIKGDYIAQSPMGQVILHMLSQILFFLLKQEFNVFYQSLERIDFKQTKKSKKYSLQIEKWHYYNAFCFV